MDGFHKAEHVFVSDTDKRSGSAGVEPSCLVYNDRTICLGRCQAQVLATDSIKWIYVSGRRLRLQ